MIVIGPKHKPTEQGAGGLCTRLGRNLVADMIVAAQRQNSQTQLTRSTVSCF